MSRKYKFLNKEGLYFVSFATVNWVDARLKRYGQVFVREMYCNILLESLSYCRLNKGLELYCWCIMPSHVPHAGARVPRVRN